MQGNRFPLDLRSVSADQNFSPSSRLTDRYTDRGRLSVASYWSGGFSMDLTYRDYFGPPKMTPFDEKMVELDFLKYETKVHMKKLNSCRFRFRDWFSRKCQSFLDAVKLTQIIAATMVPAEIKTITDFRKVHNMSRKFPRNGTPRDAGPAKMDDFIMFWSEMLELKETTDELYEKLCKYYNSVERLRQPSIKKEIDRLYEIINKAYSEDFDFSDVKNERDNLFIYKVAPFDYQYHGLMGYIPYLLTESLNLFHWLGKCHLEKE